MEIALQLATRNDRLILRNLLELCQHDYSEYNQADVDEYGLFGYSYLDHYWREAGRYPFLIKADGQLAGFVLVRRLGEETGIARYSVAEFFVLRKYRRRGVGREVAFRVFDKLPGIWCVAQEADNHPAQIFWQEVIAAYTGGHFIEIPASDEWPGPTLRFKHLPD